MAMLILPIHARRRVIHVLIMGTGDSYSYNRSFFGMHMSIRWRAVHTLFHYYPLRLVLKGFLWPFRHLSSIQLLR